MPPICHRNLLVEDLVDGHFQESSLMNQITCHSRLVHPLSELRQISAVHTKCSDICTQHQHINCRQEAQLMLTNTRDAMLDIYSGQSTVGFHCIICNYRKAYCTPSTAVRGSVRDVTSLTTAAQFNCSVFRTLPSESHPDCL